MNLLPVALFSVNIFAASARVVATNDPIAPGRLLSETSDDYHLDGCKPVVMAYARGSDEDGNVGSLGPPLKEGLNSILTYRNNFALQGVEYAATREANLLPLGTSEKAILEMVRLITDVATTCNGARIAVGGYSQGAALAARTIERLPESMKDRIGAVVLFGYTLNQQLKGGIPGFPQDKVKVYCNPYDLICLGTLNVTEAHGVYARDIPDAVKFIHA